MPRTSSGPVSYSIAAVSKLTGVSCHALRVWERRYGFPKPSRSESGHRRYPHDQVTILRLLARLANEGRLIGELIGEFRAGRLDLGRSGAGEAEARPAIALVDRLFVGDLPEAEAYLDRLSEGLGPIELIERIIEPALIDIGERWFRGESDLYRERCAACALSVRLGRLLEDARRVNGKPQRRAIIGTVLGDRHEGGVLMVSLALELAGWRALPIGVDVPVSEYRRAIEGWRPDAVALSFVLSRNINKRFEELATIRDVPVFVGGRSIVNHQGLARRHGLIPLVGPLTSVIAQLSAHVEALGPKPWR